MFVLREKDLPPTRRRELARELAEVLSEHGARLSIADPSWTVEAAHLSATAPVPDPRPRLLGRSVHRGETLGAPVDYVTYSPIHTSISKPGYGPALGLTELARYCAASPIPVYALGGIESGERAAACRAAGAYGVAVMGAVMRAADPAAVVRELLEARE